jgi:hypothetical protein
MRNARRFALALWVVGIGGTATFAASHLWTIHELYTNADGSIQFVEMYNCCAANETNLITKDVRSTSHAYVFPGNLPPNSTTDKYLLLATAGFAALPGAPVPDHIIPPNFFTLVADEVRWWNYVMPDSELNYAAGQLPTNGFHSLNQLGTGFGTPAPATPTNFAGSTFAPPGVENLTVDKHPSSADGSRLVLDAGGTACLGAPSFDIVYGWGSSLSDANPVYSIEPAAASQCGFNSLPHTWAGVPDPGGDASRFLWFVVVATDGQSTEGSWGRASDGSERLGPAAGGSSGQCGMNAKSLVNTCGP